MNNEFWESIKPWMERVLKLKKRMIEKNLTKARATCISPCDGFIVAVLAGHKKHVHAKCTKCNRSLME